MMIAVSILTVLLVLLADVALAAEGDQVFAGFLVGNGDNICLGADASILTPAGTTVNDLWTANCAQFRVNEGSAENKYTISLRSDNTQFLKLADGAASEMVNAGSHSVINFAKGGALVAHGAIKDSANQVFVIIDGGDADGTDCLELDATYTDGDAAVCSTGATVQSWYFVEACTDENCNTCTTVATCTNCNSGFRLADGSCTACSSAGCTTCDAAIDICTACSGDYVLSDGSCACTVANCMTCPVAAGTCTDCDSGYGLVGSICTVCTVSNCAECDTTVATCTACNAGYTLGNNACNEDPTDTDSGSYRVGLSFLPLLGAAIISSVMM